jgi:hypothetical protein
MDALHRVLRKIHAEPLQPASAAFRSLIESLDQGLTYDISRLYELGYNDFGLALDLIRQWRLDGFRYERGWATKVATEPSAFANSPQWMEAAAVGPSFS